MESSTGCNWLGDWLITLRTALVALSRSSASASSRAHIELLFQLESVRPQASFSTSMRGSRTRPTRVLAFVPVERGLRPCVRFFAPLRDNVITLGGTSIDLGSQARFNAAFAAERTDKPWPGSREDSPRSLETHKTWQ